MARAADLPVPADMVGAEWFIRLMNRYNNAMALMA